MDRSGLDPTTARLALDWSRDSWSAGVNVNYVGAFDVTGTDVGTFRADSYTSADVHATYRFNATGNLLDKMDVTLQVTNLLDRDPPFLLGVNGYTAAQGVYGERATQVVAAFRERTPLAKSFDIWSRIASAPIRGAAIEQCTRKAELRAAPAYLYWFTWQTPVLDGRPRAFHCAELPFVFNNAERCETMTGGGARAIDLARRMSDAWVRFARTGNPNGAGLPHWPAFSADSVSTMLFDDRCEVKGRPDAAEQAVIATVT